MSHITRIKTGLKDKEYILLALADLGYQVHEGKQNVRAFGGRATPVDILVPLRFSGDIGLRQTPNGYELVADWMTVRGVDREEFVQKLSQRYAYHATRAKLEQQGFSLSSEEVGENGQIRLVLRRMG